MAEMAHELQAFFEENNIKEFVVHIEQCKNGMQFCEGEVLQTLPEDDRNRVCACLGDMLDEGTRLGAKHNFKAVSVRSHHFAYLDEMRIPFVKGFIYTLLEVA